MSRLSVEISEQQHQQIKAMAALRGLSIKEYILEATMPSNASGESEALMQLEALLAPRIEAAARGEFSDLTIENIIAKARAQRKI